MPCRPRGETPVFNVFPWRTLLLLTFVLGGCAREGPIRAVGPNDEVSVFTNAGSKAPVKAELRRLLAYPVEVMGKEPAFLVEFIPFRDFTVYRHVKNHLFAIDLSGNDDLARSVPDMLAGYADQELLNRKPFLRIVRDRWAVGQVSLFAVAWSEPDLYRLLVDADSTEFRVDFETAVVSQLPKTMFSMGEEQGLERQMANEYGWTFQLLPGFFGAKDPQGRGAKFNAVDPVRLILVHSEDGEIPLDPSAWNGVMAEVLRSYNDGDFVLEERTHVRRHVFQGEPALRWEGVWQNEKYTIGGPFRAVACHRGGKSFLLVGMVFAPGQDKLPALRQVEAMITTFRLVR